MPKTKEQKSKEIEVLTESIKNSDGIVFADFTKVKAEKGRALKNTLIKLNGDLTVSKNTLVNKALGRLKMPKLELFGPTALIFLKGDITAGIKEVFKFKKENDVLNVKLGLIESKVFTNLEVEEIGKLPSKNVLLAKVLGGLNSPISGFASVLSGVQGKFVYTLEAIKKLKD